MGARWQSAPRRQSVTVEDLSSPKEPPNSILTDAVQGHDCSEKTGTGKRSKGGVRMILKLGLRNELVFFQEYGMLSRPRKEAE
jgi:hypothetical protein